MVKNRTTTPSRFTTSAVVFRPSALQCKWRPVARQNHSLNNARTAPSLTSPLLPPGIGLPILGVDRVTVRKNTIETTLPASA
jgi:hypothetical protein